MNEQFYSPRWYGRLVGLLLNIASTRGVKFASQEDMTFMNLYIKAYDAARYDEKECINILMRIYGDKKKYEEESHIVITKEKDGELQSRGINEASLVLRKYGSYQKLVEEMDFYAEEEQRMKEAKKKIHKRNKIVGGCIFALVLFIVIYNLPFFKEWRFYNEVVDTRQITYCHEYYSEYPNGRHYEDVMALEMELTHKPIVVAMQYLKTFPNGKYKDMFNEKCDSLWNEEINKYEKRDKSNENPKAVAFMKEMLQQMKKYRINTVLLDIIPNIDLKDYEDYNENIREITEFFYKGEKLPLKGNIVSLKENFTQGDKLALSKILANGVQEGFGQMFSSDFVSVVTQASETVAESPRLVFNYTVSNQNVEGKFPNIWTYSENKIAKAYILGIDVKFDVDFSIPNSDVTYTYSEIGEPGNEISGILNIKDGYRQMTQICFAKFSNKMSMNLGLEQSYFKENVNK